MLSTTRLILQHAMGPLHTKATLPHTIRVLQCTNTQNYISVVPHQKVSHVPSGKLSGFGHIQFDTEEAVQRALKLHGADLMGRELFVDAAVNKPPDAVGASGKAVEGCWFCLSNPNADVNLIASIGASAFTVCMCSVIGC